jgi:uridine phosphorylase
VEDARVLADHRAFRLWTGRAGALQLTACSAGTGSASAAIAIEELAVLGARTILGVGAAWDASRARAGVVVAEGALRFDAASHGYARTGYPAAADHALVLAADAASRAAGIPASRDIVGDVEAEPPRCGRPRRAASPWDVRRGRRSTPPARSRSTDPRPCSSWRAAVPGR